MIGFFGAEATIKINTLGEELIRMEKYTAAAAEIYYPIWCQSSFSGVYLVFEGFQERKFAETLAVSYLVLQACISLLRCFRQKWHTSVFALFAWKCRCSHVFGNDRWRESGCFMGRREEKRQNLTLSPLALRAQRLKNARAHASERIELLSDDFDPAVRCCCDQHQWLISWAAVSQTLSLRSLTVSTPSQLWLWPLRSFEHDSAFLDVGNGLAWLGWRDHDILVDIHWTDRRWFLTLFTMDWIKLLEILTELTWPEYELLQVRVSKCDERHDSLCEPDLLMSHDHEQAICHKVRADWGALMTEHMLIHEQRRTLTVVRQLGAAWPDKDVLEVLMEHELAEVNVTITILTIGSLNVMDPCSESMLPSCVLDLLAHGSWHDDMLVTCWVWLRAVSELMCNFEVHILIHCITDRAEHHVRMNGRRGWSILWHSRWSEQSVDPEWWPTTCVHAHREWSQPLILTWGWTTRKRTWCPHLRWAWVLHSPFECDPEDWLILLMLSLELDRKLACIEHWIHELHLSSWRNGWWEHRSLSWGLASLQVLTGGTELMLPAEEWPYLTLLRQARLWRRPEEWTTWESDSADSNLTLFFCWGRSFERDLWTTSGHRNLPDSEHWIRE